MTRCMEGGGEGLIWVRKTYIYIKVKGSNFVLIDVYYYYYYLKNWKRLESTNLLSLSQKSIGVWSNYGRNARK